MMITNFVDALKDEIVGAVCECVRIPSVAGEPGPDAPFGPGPKKVLDWTLDLAKRMGFRTGCVDNMAGWAEMGDGKEMVAVLGHLDVVPEGDGWTYPSHGGEIHDGKIYGRGVLDDKGPTIGALFAMKAVQQSGVKLSRRIRVIFGTNEERGSACMKRYVESGQDLPVAGFTPDADYPVIFAEKGVLGLDLEAQFTPEGPVRIVSMSGGVAKNVVAEHATVEIETDSHGRKRVLDAARAWKGPEKSSVTIAEDGTRVTLAFSGLPAHGSTPEKGVNAILCLFDFCAGLNLPGRQGAFFADAFRLIGCETDGKSLGAAMQDDISGALTVCVGLLAGDEKKASFTINIRYPISKKMADVMAPIETAFGASCIRIAGTSNANPLHIPKDSELVTTLRRVYREETGTDPEPLAIGGGTYAKTMPNVVAFGPIHPGQDYVIHAADECWSVDDLMGAVRMAAKAMIELAK